jgi:putative hydrolase
VKIEVDTHCHTLASGHAYSTILENVKVAAEKGLKMIAITDHGPAMPGTFHEAYFGYMKVLPREIEGVYVLKGIEANITDINGTLDISDRFLRKMDIVLAGFHKPCYIGGTVEQNTRAAIGVMKNPYVDILVHPGNPDFPINIERVVNAAKSFNVCIEINNSSLTVTRKGSFENCVNIAKRAAEVGAKTAVGSDAHVCFDVGNFDEALKIIKNAGISGDNLLNTSRDKVVDFLRSKGKTIAGI